MAEPPSREACLALIEHRGVRDPKILAALRAVPRELFVSAALRADAYRDEPLPIGEGQTISQPFIVAFMIELLGLRGGEKVLEIGAGSGYAAAVLSKIASRVFAIERRPALTELARANLKAAGCGNVRIKTGDGTEGWRDEAPFDALLVSAGAPQVPHELVQQLAIGGHMVIPVGSDPRAQTLLRVTRRPDGEADIEEISPVRFVPLIGHHGWASDHDAPDCPSI